MQAVGLLPVCMKGERIMSVKESYAGKINRKLNKKLHVIYVAAGRVPADLVLKNAPWR